MASNSIYDTFPGYETMLTEGEGLCHPPVLSDQHPHPEAQPSCPHWEIPPLSKDDAHRAFMKYASEYWHSTKPAEEAVITSMEAFNAYRYRLETFLETRTAKWKVKPYHGKAIDSSGQTPPGPWEITASTPPLFVDGSQIIEVPHTSSVKACYRCRGSAKIQCVSCTGTGSKKCFLCCGTGYCSPLDPTRKICMACFGQGSKTCWDCNGRGTALCKVCSGNQKLLVSIDLVVDWLCSMDEHVVEQSSGLKMFHLRKATGHVVFTDSDNMVRPVTHFPNRAVAEDSDRLQREHWDKFGQTSRILQQRQTVELIPITKVTYRWRGESHVFFVFGRDLRVSADDFPAACCDGCCTFM